MKNLKELLEERARIAKEMRGILEKADKETKGNLTDEQRAKYDELFAETEKIRERVEREEKQAAIEKALEAPLTKRADISTAEATKVEKQTERKVELFRSYVRGGIGGMSEMEVRDLQAGSLIEGGSFVAPQEWVNELIKAMDNLTFIRRLGRVFKLGSAVSLGVPTLTADPADADWTTELGTGSNDTTMKTGKRELKPGPIAKRIKLSEMLLQHSVINVEDLVRERFAYVFGITEERAFLTGNGAAQPLGLFTASASGISTGRDMSTDNTTTAITFDGLKNNQYNVKPQYQARAGWLLHRDAVKMIAKIKDTTNQYIWEPSTQVGQPDLLLGRPVYQSEYVPNTFTTGLYVGMFGDFAHYWIAETMNFRVKRLVELYAEANQVGFIARSEVDGMPVLEEAFSRIKLA